MKKRSAYFLTLFMCLTLVFGCSKNDEPSKPNESIYNNHEYVDLGLPSGVKWATCNVGASSTTEAGEYFAWGDTKPRTDYSNYTLPEGKTFSNISGDPEYDAAAANWGGKWRMPTLNDFEELFDNCEWTYTEIDAMKGYEVKGPNNNSIFLPCAGRCDTTDIMLVGTFGYYWGATFNEEEGTACFINLSDRSHRILWNPPYFGYPIRPVFN